MNQHYSEADLLETYYMQPGQSMPVMMHVADCSECAARYERLERKLRSLAACEHDQPETFWARQRMSIMRRVGGGRMKPARHLRAAAAAVLVVVLGGYAAWRTQTPPPAAPVKTNTVAVVETATTTSLTDSPWESEPLDDYQSMVAWESWVDEDKKKTTGDHS